MRARLPWSATRRADGSPLVNPKFARLWYGQVVTDLGTVEGNTSLVIWIAASLARGASWAPLAVSGALGAQALPQIVVRPLAGVLVDRLDARTLMLRMDAARAAVSVALLVPALAASLALGLRLALLYAGVLAMSVCTQFFSPALLRLIGDIVEERDLARASGLSEVTWNVASVLGPPLAAPLVLLWGLWWALALNAISFVISYLTLRAIRIGHAHVSGPHRRAPSPARADLAQVWRDLREGMAFVAREPVVRTLTLALSVAMLGAGTLRALDFFFVTRTLHAAPALYGLVGPAFGGGSILGALLAGRLAPRLGMARTFAGSMLCVGLALVVLSRQSSLAPALVAWIAMGIVNSASNVALLPLLLGATPRALVGRMNALFFTIIGAVALLSSTVAGWLASVLPSRADITALGMRFGAVDSLLLVGGLLICLGGGVAVRAMW